jgi:hypothetical protein
MMMGNVNISPADPAIGSLLKLLTDPKAAAKAKELLQELKAAVEKHDQAATLARDQVASAWNTASAAEKLLEDANTKHEELKRRELAVAAREAAVAKREAVIEKLRQEFA